MNTSISLFFYTQLCPLVEMANSLHILSFSQNWHTLSELHSVAGVTILAFFQEAAALTSKNLIVQKFQDTERIQIIMFEIKSSFLKYPSY